jgi:SNF2 family DNA or RNA helicase
MRLYSDLERELLIGLDDGEIVAPTAAVLANKLLQMANGAAYDTEGKPLLVHDAKLEALEDLIEQANGEPVLVFYAYRHDEMRIRAAIPEAEPLDVDRWNLGEQPVALAHPGSCGHGLNLQAGGHIIVWFGLTWSLELYDQACGRLHRQGQKEPVRVYHLVAEGTMDEQVMR